MKNITLFFFFLFLWQINLAQIVSTSQVTQTSSNISSNNVNVFFNAGILGDTIVHLVWENYDSQNVKEVVLESSNDGVDFVFLSKAVISTLIDINAYNYPATFNYFNSVFMSGEHGNMRYLYNDIVTGQNIYQQAKWYRVKMITFTGQIYYSQIAGTAPEEVTANLNAQVEAKSENKNSTDEEKGSQKTGCNPIGSPPSGYSSTGQTQTYYGTCCYWVETKYQSTGPVQTSCGGNSYAWCCNNVPGAGGCSSGYVSDPCCVHYCNQYYSCSCPPWQCCTSSTVSAWVVTQSVSYSPISINVSITNETCVGTHDGAITVTPSNGTAPYTYTWSPSVGSGATITGLAGGSYSVTVTDAHGCALHNNYTVSSNPGVIPEAGPDQSICNGASASLTALGGVSYIWSGGLGNTASITVSPTSTTVYTVTVASAQGCSATDFVTVNVFVVPADAGNDQIICLNQSANLTAYGGVSYEWSYNNLTSQSINVSPPVTTVYTVTVTDVNGCTNTDFVTVSVNNLPSASAGPDQAICYSFSTTLNAGGGTIYVWNPTTGLSDPNIATPTANPLNTTLYTVTVTDANGCSAIDDMTLTVNPLPVVSAGTDQTICIGSSANLQATGGVSYVWSPATGLSDPNISNPVATPQDTITYTVTATDANGCTGVDAVVVNVNLIPTSDFTVTSPVCVAQSNSAITYTGTGTINASYNWDFAGGTIFSGSGQGPYQISWNTPATYNVSLTVTENGCTSPTTTLPVVVGQVTATLAVTDSISCYGVSDGEVTATPLGLPSYIYLWSDSQNTQTAINLSADTLYTVTITDANACTTSQSIILTQPQPLAMIFTTQDVQCFAGHDGIATAIISGGTTSYSYNWQPAGTAPNVNSVSTLQAGNYSLTVTDLHGCSLDTGFTISQPPLLTYTYTTDSVNCNGGSDGSICLTPTGGVSPYTYTWAPGVTNGNCANNIAAGTYNVTVTDAHSCDTAASIAVYEPLPLVLSTSGNDSICYGSSSTISASATGGTGSYTFTWDQGLGIGNSFTVNPTVTTAYSVSVTDANSCTTSPQSLTIFVSPVITVSVTASPAALCIGGSSTLTATPNGGNGNYTFTWGPGIGVSTQSIVVTPSTTTMYTITVSDNCGSPVGIDSVEVIIYPLPTVQFSSDVYSGCEPLLVSFTDNSTPAIGQWLWDFGDPLSGSSNNSTSQNPTHLYSSAGTYTVTLSVETTNGCDGSYTHTNMIVVYPTPDAYFIMHPDVGSTQDPTITFTDQSTNASYWEWDFGDPTSGSDNSSYHSVPMHTFTGAGTFTIHLYVESPFGCSDTTSNNILIKQDFAIYFPNAFTPNDDLLNDGWRPQGVGVSPDDYSLYIFDRWGEMVFKTNDFNASWDGKKMGSDQLPVIDVYNWIAYVKDIYGERYFFKGRVTIVL